MGVGSGGCPRRNGPLSMTAVSPCCRFCGLTLSTADSHEGLCANLEKNGVLRSQAAKTAFRSVDRADFAPPGAESEAYLDAALVLGAGAQISAPHVHASALELLADCAAVVGPGLQALDVGSGSGYMCTLLAEFLRGSRGSVLAVEHIEELVAAARMSVARHHGELLAPEGNLKILCEDARRLAERPEHREAFDLVHCGAALAEPEPWLVGLLRPGGRAVVPLGPTDSPQWLSTVDKRPDGEVEVARHIRVLYVPVTSAAAQRARGDCWDDVVERCARNASVVLSTGPATDDDEDLYS